MLFALAPLKQVLGAARSGPTGLSVAQGMRLGEEHGWFMASGNISVVLSMVSLLQTVVGASLKVRLCVSAAILFVFGITVIMALVSTALPAVEGFLNEYLPTVVQPFCHALLVNAPHAVLACLVPAHAALVVFCDFIVWLTVLTVAAGLVAAEAAVYISTFAFLATTWAFVYRDLVHVFRMRTSSSYRADQRARDMQLTIRQFFDLESRFGTLQTWLDNVLPQTTQRTLAAMFPLAALDIFDTASPADLAQARAVSAALSQRARGGALAAMASIYRGLTRLLEEEARAAHPSPLAHPLSHFLRHSSRTASAIIAHLPFLPLKPNADKPSAFSLRLFLPLLLTYPGCLALEYLRWRRSCSSPNLGVSDVDPDAPHFVALHEISTILHVNARSLGLDAQQLEQLVETYVAMVRVRRQAVAVEVVAFRAILDAVLDWKNRKNELEMHRFKQD